MRSLTRRQSEWEPDAPKQSAAGAHCSPISAAAALGERFGLTRGWTAHAAARNSIVTTSSLTRRPFE
jgi:hypothetical protein